MYASPKRSAFFSGLLHAAAIVLILWLTGGKDPPIAKLAPVFLVDRDIGRYVPRVPRNMDGGGGGGARDDTPASRGRLPRPALRQFTPPVAAILNTNPRLAMEPTIIADPEVILPAVSLPNYGDPNGVLGMLSSGRGSGGGIGDGSGGGVGNRAGPGYGNGGDGGGVTGYSGIRAAITPPVLLWKTEPEYTEEARKARLSGLVELYLQVDERGQARNIVVRHGLGLGLDERAVEAVRRWKFRPGYQNGKPVVTPALVEVSFRLL